MNRETTRKFALITGAGARVGRAIAVELAQSKFHLFLHYHQNHHGAEQTLDLVKKSGGTGEIFQADLGQVQECQTLTDKVKERSQTLHLLVNNASLFYPCAFSQLDLVAWQEMFAVNLQAPYLLSHYLLDCLKQDGGLIINLCDIGTKRPLKGYSHYTSSKAGLVGLTKSLAVELAPSVRCVGISPGQVAWPEDYTQTQRDQLSQRIPMKKGGTPEDVATLVRYITLEGHYLNGTIIPVDGGLSCRY